MQLMFVVAVAVMLAFGAPLQVHSAEPGGSIRTNVLDDPNFFPIAVWLQNPSNAGRFKEAGINLYVGLYRGPTAEQLETLRKHGMHVICRQSERSLAFKDDPTIVAWMHDDEPDNAQAQPQGQKGWGPPVLPAVIQEDYEKIRAKDPTRPVFLNLGQGVAWDNWIGRGVRRNRPEDYPEYVRGADIVSFDIYPVVHDNDEVAGRLEFVARGVERLRNWAGVESKRKVWNCIEAARVDNPNVKATPEQIRSEVWMSIIKGSRGIVYFVHQFKPNFIEASLLEDPVTLAGVTKINAQVKELAPVINSPTVESSFEISAQPKVEIASMVKRHGGTNYLFMVSMENRATEVTIKSAELARVEKIAAIGESRDLKISDEELRERFEPYQVHLYRFTSGTK